jgi:serine/threonine protein kinase
LRVLNGLDGNCPREYDAVNKDGQGHCELFSIFMDKIGGVEAKAWLAGATSALDGIEYLKQGVGILKKLHSLGFAHNDAHGGNIMVDTTGGHIKVSLIDFGFARPLSSKDGKLVVWMSEPSPMRNDLLILFQSVQSLLAPYLTKSASLVRILKSS